MHLTLERSYPTPLTSSPLLPLLLLSLARQRHSPDGTTRIKKEYDFIIVGGGSAGSVVASRLSELPCVDVLLIEAGHEPPLLTEVPALSRYFWFTDVDWQYKTAPQKHTGSLLRNKQVVWPSGKMLGGSSSLNGMRYVRGNMKNYDDWANQGAEGWSYKEVHPYFLKMENNVDRDFLANGYHTTGGPVTVHQPRYNSDLKETIQNAVTRMGYKIVDSNAAKQTGFYDHQATLRDNQRCSTAKAYLVPAENRTNLDILTNARVKQVIIRENRARGVLYDFEGHTYEVMARKEVILSTGTVNTAQLLMLSGVGPQKELQRLNIPVVADLPVGQNLQDHGGTHIPFVMSPHTPNFETKISDPYNVQQYIKNRTGPLASTEGVNYLAFLNGQAIYPSKDFPNYELSFTEMPPSIPRDQFGLRPEIYKKLYGPYQSKALFMCTVSQLQPRSRGTVTLQSKSPYDPPIIDPNYLANPRDVEDLVQGMKTCQRIGTSETFQKMGIKSFKTLIPGCEKFANDEDNYFTCQVRSIFVTLHNSVGTAKMGDPRDPTTVVDPKLRVKNINGLRVVDASVMPIITSGDTNVPTIMIAERASDLIKENIHCYRHDLQHWEDSRETSDWSEEKHSEEYSKNSKEYRWEYEYNNGPDDHWNSPDEDGWLNKEKNSQKEYFKPPVMNPWSHNDDCSEEEYLDEPQKSPWSDEGKYYLRDYIKNPKELSLLIKNEKSSLDDYWKDSKPFSWYKKQTDTMLKEFHKPIETSWTDDEDDSNSIWHDQENFKFSKNIEELIKLAEQTPDEKVRGYRWNKSYRKPPTSWYK